MFLFLFLIYLFLEILTTYFVMKLIGPVGFFIEVIVTALAGALIIKNFSFTMLEYVKEMALFQLTPEEVISIGVFKFLGAILLIIPGAFSDLLGALMVIDFTGQLFAQLLFSGRTHPPVPRPHSDEPEIIDVEVIEEKKRS
jgi:UPF0716 family protein affecting phage T7 exclusion